MAAAPAFPPAPDLAPVKRALISVSDKTGLIDTATALAALGVELVSTGGTRAAIAAAGLVVKDISELTGFPEMMDGRVKTLHPVVHGGLLGVRDAPEHARAMGEHGIGGIDLLYVNLYPFEETVAAGGDFAACVENIDIGGPAMIRSAAKNHGYVAVCTAPEDVAEVLAALQAEGATSLALRKRLAARAYARTAAYDAAIAAWFAGAVGDTAPARKTFTGQLIQTTRYGENAHQRAAFYGFAAPRRIGVATARQLQGKELSYNNFNDTDAAFELVAEFDPAESAAVAIIKHANPCGVALGADLKSAYLRALQCDPVSAFGGIVAVNRRLDAEAARDIVDIFTEVVIAPDADEDAIALFAKKKNLRLLLTGGLPDPYAAGESFKSLSGGFLVQSRDNAHITAADLKVVTKRAPTAREVEDMLFAFTIAKHVKSNSMSSTSRAVGALFVTTFRSDAVTCARSRDCTRKPPATERKFSPAAIGSGRAPVSSRRRFFFLAKMAMASSSASGAMTTSVRILTISSAAAPSSRRFSATMPPKAETGSHSSARR